VCCGSSGLFFYFGAGERERGGEQVLLTSVQGFCANSPLKKAGIRLKQQVKATTFCSNNRS